MIATSHGKLYNDGGELLGEGPCQVDEERGSVTMRPVHDIPELERQHGALHLELEDGSSMVLTHRVIKFRVNLPGKPPGPPGYRMFKAGQQPLSPPPGPPPVPPGPPEIPPEFRRPEIPPEFRRGS